MVGGKKIAACKNRICVNSKDQGLCLFQSKRIHTHERLFRSLSGQFNQSNFVLRAELKSDRKKSSQDGCVRFCTSRCPLDLWCSIFTVFLISLSRQSFNHIYLSFLLNRCTFKICRSASKFIKLNMKFSVGTDALRRVCTSFVDTRENNLERTLSRSANYRELRKLRSYREKMQRCLILLYVCMCTSRIYDRI